MSADNGIYVLVTPGKNGNKEYRVAYAMAIDNIDYYDRETQREEYDQELINYFGDCKVLCDRIQALEHASDLDLNLRDRWGFPTEYGICFIELKHEFPIKSSK